MIHHSARHVKRAAAPKVKIGSPQMVLGAALLVAGLSASAQTLPSVTLAWDASASSGISGYRLYEGGASQTYTNTLSLGNVTTATVPGLTPGATYYFAVSAVGTNGLESARSSEISYTVPVATPPTIVLSAPANGTSYTAPATVDLAATVVPNGHTISKVQFYNGSTLLAEDTAAPYTFTWSNVSAGSYSLSAKLVYDTSSTLASAAANITVTAPQPGTNLTFAATSGNISGPFVASNGTISQTVETGVTNGGRAAYTFSVASSGDYLITAQVSAPNGAANSFYVNVDAEPVDPTMIWDIPVTAGLTNQTVAWRGNGTVDVSQFVPKVFNLAQGTHQLIIRGREANTQLGTISIVPASALPAPWQTADLGKPGMSGSAAITSGRYSVAGAGNLSGGADNFRFLYQPLSGDGEIRAQISSMQNTSSNARAGIMIRETLTPGSKYAFMGISPDGRFRAQRRVSTSGTTASTTSGTGTLPNTWARLVRSGNTFSSYKSSNGTNWTLVKTTTNVMAANIYVGFAVASGSTNVLNTSAFTNAVVVP